MVREIYERYKNGASLRNLKDWLEENQIKTVLGTADWSISVIKGILTNKNTAATCCCKRPSARM